MGKRKPTGSSVTVRAREAVDAVADIIGSVEPSNPSSRMFIRGAANEYAKLHGLAGAGIRDGESGDWGTDLDRIIRARVQAVENAAVYLLEDSALDVTVAAAQAVTEQDTMAMTIDDLPAARGFLMLPRNIYLTSRSTVTPKVDIRAISWEVGDCLDDDQWRRDVRFALWTETVGGVGDVGYTTMIRLLQEDGVWLPRLIYASSAFVPKNQWTREGVHLIDPAKVTQVLDAEDSSRPELREYPQRDGYALSDSTDEYVSGAAIPDHRGTFSVRFMFAFARLCAQDNGLDVTRVRDKIPGLAERTRERPEDTVLITSLHPRRAVGGGPRSGPVNWSSRWVVKMHARRQWYPSKGTHEVIFVGPYVKGPEDKPMKRDGGPTPPRVTVIR